MYDIKSRQKKQQKKNKQKKNKMMKNKKTNHIIDSSKDLLIHKNATNEQK